MIGVGLGMPVRVTLVGADVIRLFEVFPIVQPVLTVLSVAHLAVSGVEASPMLPCPRMPPPTRPAIMTIGRQSATNLSL